MVDGPNIVNIAALIGDHARAAMLTALMSGEALTATELANEACVTKQTASSHLRKMKDAGLIEVASQGRHRYYRLSGADVAHMLENLMGIAQRTGASRIQLGPRDPDLRKSRVCYDHLAGELAVSIYDAFLEKKFIRVNGKSDNGNPIIELTNKGYKFCAETGIELTKPVNSRRPECKSCLDWSERRFHIAGLLGKSILSYCYRHRLAKRIHETRIIKFSVKNEKVLRKTFQIL